MKMSNSIQVENIEHGKSLFVSISVCLSNRKRLGKFNDLIKLLSGLKEKLDTAETDSWDLHKSRFESISKILWPSFEQDKILW